MRRSRRAYLLAVALMVGVLLGFSGVAFAARVPNGGFEAGNFGHWTVVEQPGSAGSWFLYSGTTTPLKGRPISAPPDGSFAATTDMTADSSNVLYRNIHLRDHMKHKLVFYLYYQNYSPMGNSTPPTLDYTTPLPNQQYRVDLMKPNSDPFSLNAKAILAPIFRTDAGEPGYLEPTRITYNLTRFAGRTVRLRFAQVNNEQIFLASVDKVHVNSTRK